MHPDNVEKIAGDLGVSEAEVISMNRRLSGGDASLNAMIGADGESSMEWQDWLEDEDADQAADYEFQDELSMRRDMLNSAMTGLNDRERDILTQRRLVDEVKTLEELSEIYAISRERVRQIAVRAFEKLQEKIANKLGYKLMGHKLELYGVPLKKS